MQTSESRRRKAESREPRVVGQASSAGKGGRNFQLLTLNSQPSTFDRSGFTLIELLVVIGIIAILVGFLGVMIVGMLGQAKEKTTAATIRKIHGLLQQRIEAFNRALDKENLETEIDEKKKSILPSSPDDVTDDAARILVLKDRFRAAFPQQFSELADQTDADSDGIPDVVDSDDAAPPTKPHAPVTQSAAMLYYMLTSMQVFGIAPVDASDFLSSEVADTDGDGLMEFVDAWGRPLRFYHWPTRLIKPNGSDIDRTTADLLIKGLPPAAQLGEDPDDPLNLLTTASPVDLSLQVNETTYHTLDTYHVPLIVSAGGDGVLGLYEPDEAADFGTLAQPGGDGLTWPADSVKIIDALTDNITNRNRRAGGN